MNPAPDHPPAERPLVDPADFDLDEDCCLSGCCEGGKAYLLALAEATEAAEADLQMIADAGCTVLGADHRAQSAVRDDDAPANA